ncbi:MAG: cytochrome c maturation protein CcmE [Deltaproteobacteria bacterium]|nr:MAG: cytochrome c maturation protein CcmE [Deltaproteobacteria bacterium]
MSETEREEDERSGLPIWLPIAGVFALLAAGVAFLLFGSDTSDAFVYSKLVEEVMADPNSHRDRELRVEGELRQGSIEFRAEPCEWRFVLEQEGHEMAVSYPQCVVPDTFRDGMGISVTVQGRLQDDDSFLANQVVPRCPSKYEMDQREENGEAVPHAGQVPTADNT